MGGSLLALAKAIYYCFCHRYQRVDCWSFPGPFETELLTLLIIIFYSITSTTTVLEGILLIGSLAI